MGTVILDLVCGHTGSTIASTSEKKKWAEKDWLEAEEMNAC
jgi:hypothetical protein